MRWSPAAARADTSSPPPRTVTAGRRPALGRQLEHDVDHSPAGPKGAEHLSCLDAHEQVGTLEAARSTFGVPSMVTDGGGRVGCPPA